MDDGSANCPSANDVGGWEGGSERRVEDEGTLSGGTEKTSGGISTSSTILVLRAGFVALVDVRTGVVEVLVERTVVT